jgi:hypothetical protein
MMDIEVVRIQLNQEKSARLGTHKTLMYTMMQFRILVLMVFITFVGIQIEDRKQFGVIQLIRSHHGKSAYLLVTLSSITVIKMRDLKEIEPLSIEDVKVKQLMEILVYHGILKSFHHITMNMEISMELQEDTIIVEILMDLRRRSGAMLVIQKIQPKKNVHL